MSETMSNQTESSQDTIKPPYLGRIERIRSNCDIVFAEYVNSLLKNGKLTLQDINYINNCEEANKIVYIAMDTKSFIKMIEEGRYRTILDVYGDPVYKNHLLGDIYFDDEMIEKNAVARVEVEEKLGIHPSGTSLDPDLIYGWVVPKTGLDAELTTFPIVQIMLKEKGIRGRATIVVNDSYLALNRDYEVGVYTWEYCSKLLKCQDLLESKDKYNHHSERLETQIAGGLNLEKDISEVRIYIGTEREKEALEKSEIIKTFEESNPEIRVNINVIEYD